MADTVVVGIADLKVVKVPDVVATYALGSCVGICLYDAARKIAGLAHIMLPTNNAPPSPSNNLRKFADTGIPELIQLMSMNGAAVMKLSAKIAGGAQMFKTNSELFNIGDRNVAAVKKILAANRIPIVAQETGSNFGRTVFFYSEDGVMEIRAANRLTTRL